MTRVYEYPEGVEPADWSDGNDVAWHTSMPPRWVWHLSGLIVVVVLLAAGVIWYEVVDERGENRHQCEQTVEFRENQRAMWNALFDTYPDAAIETGLREFLDDTQPPLECHGSSPTPVPIDSDAATG